MPDVEQKFLNLAKRLMGLQTGRYFAVVMYYGHTPYYTIKQMADGDYEPPRLKQTVIEDALNGLKIGTYFWTVHATPSRMAIEGRRVGRVEN